MHGWEEKPIDPNAASSPGPRRDRSRSRSPPPRRNKNSGETTSHSTLDPKTRPKLGIDPSPRSSLSRSPSRPRGRRSEPNSPAPPAFKSDHSTSFHILQTHTSSDHDHSIRIVPPSAQGSSAHESHSPSDQRRAETHPVRVGQSSRSPSAAVSQYNEERSTTDMDISPSLSKVELPAEHLHQAVHIQAWDLQQETLTSGPQPLQPLHTERLTELLSTIQTEVQDRQSDADLRSPGIVGDPPSPSLLGYRGSTDSPSATAASCPSDTISNVGMSREDKDISLVLGDSVR